MSEMPFLLFFQVQSVQYRQLDQLLRFFSSLYKVENELYLQLIEVGIFGCKAFKLSRANFFILPLSAFLYASFVVFFLDICFFLFFFSQYFLRSVHSKWNKMYLVLNNFSEYQYAKSILNTIKKKTLEKMKHKKIKL